MEWGELEAENLNGVSYWSKDIKNVDYALKSKCTSHALQENPILLPKTNYSTDSI
jgi:hypothetical protein